MVGSCTKHPEPISWTLTHLEKHLEEVPCPPGRGLLLVAIGRSPSALSTESLFVRKGTGLEQGGLKGNPRAHSAEKGGTAGSTSASEGPGLSGMEQETGLGSEIGGPQL